MATGLTLVRRALRLARVIASGDTPRAATIQDALSVLNSMLAEWHKSGINLPDYRIASEASTLTMDDGDVEAVAHQLAIRILPEYGREPSLTLAANSAEAMSRLRLRYFQPGKTDLSELPCPTGWATDYSVEVE
jgi:hypothetical protein